MKLREFAEAVAAMLFLAVAIIWAAALVLAGPALLKFCILFLFG